MPKQEVRSATEKILCPLTFNAEDGDYCCRERCALFHVVRDQCALRSQAITQTQIYEALSGLLELLHHELPAIRQELAQIGGAIIHKP